MTKMTTKFMMGGSTVHVFNLNDETARDELKPRLYTLAYSRSDGFFLNFSKDKLDLPTTIYGNAPTRVKKCIQTYKDRTASTGILLTGDKGTGKSLLMSLLANQAIDELKLPVILIKQAYNGVDFTNFIEMLGECVVIFDEFGKMYTSSNQISDNEVPQTELLSLMDGVDKTKRMFIMTENREMDINDFILNRPSRVYYHFKYRKLDESSITDYCKDKSVDITIVEDILHVARKSKIFSFDILQTIVEEHLRYGSTITECTQDLNIDLSEDTSEMMEILEIYDTGTKNKHKVWGNPQVNKPDGNYVHIKIQNTNYSPLTDDDDDAYNAIYVEDSMLKYAKDDKLIYETRGYTFVAKQMPRPVVDYSALF